MTTVFVDAAYLIAIARDGDQWHDAAMAAHDALGNASLVTTDEVLTEFLTAMSNWGPRMRELAVRTVVGLLDASDTQVIPQSRQGFLDGLARYEGRPDKGYSLQDCVSMNVMEAEGITEVLTSDHNFEQEGFRVLIEGWGSRLGSF